MNKTNLWISAAAAGALSLLVTNLPYIGFVNCLLCAGFWGSAIFGTWLYRRLNGNLAVREAVKVGLLSGLLAGVIGFALSFLGLTGVQGLFSGLEGLLPAEELQEMQAIPDWAGWIINLVGVIFEVGCGALGGWIGGAIFRTKPPVQQEGSRP